MGFSFKIVHGKCMKTVLLSIKAGQHSAEKEKRLCHLSFLESFK